MIALIYVTDPIDVEWSRDVKNRTQFAIKFAKAKGILNQGDLVLQLSCSKENAGFVDSMNVFYVSATNTVTEK